MKETNKTTRYAVADQSGSAFVHTEKPSFDTEGVTEVEGRILKVQRSACIVQFTFWIKDEGYLFNRRVASSEFATINDRTIKLSNRLLKALTMEIGQSHPSSVIRTIAQQYPESIRWTEDPYSGTPSIEVDGVVLKSTTTTNHVLFEFEFEGKAWYFSKFIPIKHMEKVSDTSLRISQKEFDLLLNSISMNHPFSQVRYVARYRPEIISWNKTKTDEQDG